MFLASFLTKTLPVDGETVRLDIWDTAGQERYHCLTPMYYRGAQAALVVYDITDKVCYNFYTLAIILIRLRLIVLSNGSRSCGGNRQ